MLKFQVVFKDNFYYLVTTHRDCTMRCWHCELKNLHSLATNQVLLQTLHQSNKSTSVDSYLHIYHHIVYPHLHPSILTLKHRIIYLIAHYN